MRNRALTTTLISLTALASVTFLGKSYEPTLRGIDSNIHAAASMSVTAGGGLKPRLPIPLRPSDTSTPVAPGEKVDSQRYFNDHPFFLFWVNGLVMRALGPSGWSARLLTAAFSVGSVLVTYSLGATLVSSAFGVLAALFLIFCRDFVLTSATVSLDTALVFFILLTFLFWIQKRWLALGLAAGLGLWMKTPLVLLVFPTALIYEAIQGKLKEKLPKLLAVGILAVGVGSLVWIYTGLNGGWGLVQDYWVRQLWGTAVGGRAQAGTEGSEFFFRTIKNGFLPGLPFFFIALVQIARRRQWREPAFQIPVIAVGILGTVVTLMRFKLGHYLTPAFPFLALISAYSVVRWITPREEAFYAWTTRLSVLLIAVLLISPISLGPEPFVALKRFMPLIQTHGACDDLVALVPGGEPVGADLDYSLALNFYTGRRIESFTCEKISARILGANAPQWLIIAHENLERCLSPQAHARFTAQYLVGNQYLLTSRLAGRGIVDLTPLELELKAVTDCQAPAYPQDTWHRYIAR